MTNLLGKIILVMDINNIAFYLLTAALSGFIAGLFFSRFKKTQNRKKLAQKKNSRQILAKNSRYRSHLNISAKKLKIFSLSGTYFDRF